MSMYVAEDLLGVAVVEGDRRAGERDQRRVRQGVAQVPGVAVEVVVVAAVRLVDDHDDVAAVGQQRVLGAGVLLGLAAAELLQRGEVDAAGGAVAQLVAEFGALRDLLGVLGAAAGCGRTPRTAGRRVRCGR